MIRTCNPTETAGFSLVEVTLALGVAGFCLLAIFGLLPVALNSNQTAIEQTTADSVMTAIVSDLRATPATAPTAGLAAVSGQYAINIPAASGSGSQTLYFANEQQTTATATGARYRATVNFVGAPSGGGTKSAMCLSVKVTWPAVVDPSTGTPAGVVQSFVALDRN